MGISKAKLIGPISLATFSAVLTTNLHEIACTDPPGNLRIVHVTVLVASSYSHACCFACGASSTVAPVDVFGTVKVTLTFAPWSWSPVRMP